MKSTLFLRSVLSPLCVSGVLAGAIATLFVNTAVAQNADANAAKKIAPASKKVPPPPTPSCAAPVVWSLALAPLTLKGAAVPTQEPASDCEFHQWSWESFVWATSIDTTTNAPRFLGLPTPKDILTAGFVPGQNNAASLSLELGTRVHNKSSKQIVEKAGAIVEADGNVLIDQNGYPVYASVHMNTAYFNTAKNNMIFTGQYVANNNAPNDQFPQGAIVFKATWRRIDGTPPAHSYVIKAKVPVLQLTNGSVVPVPGQTKEVTVALVGLHVVGRPKGHPEFLWATFEQNNNAPMVPDGSFSTQCPTPAGKCVDIDPNGHTFYQGGTPFAQTNIATSNTPATVAFDVTTQKFSPVTQVVQANRTGGENSPNGVQNILTLNTAGQAFMAQQANAQAVFQNYRLIGTVWLAPGSYSRATPNWWNLGSTNPVGSVNLANSTAETFQQVPQANQPGSNCFACHNPTAFGGTQGTLNAQGSFTSLGSPTQGQSGLPARLIGISHVIAAQAAAAVPNSVPANVAPSCVNVNAGPIISNVQAQTTCPATCASATPVGKWNGQWTTQANMQSVCQCCQ